MIAFALLPALSGWAQASALLDSLSQNTGLPSPIGGNSIELLLDGTRYYDDALGSIEEARDYILMESYIFRQDSISTRFLDALARKAEDGVKVYLVLDYIGCAQHIEERSLSMKPFSKGFIESYIDKGLSIAFYNREGGFPRDHRKLLIVDGQVAYAGGINITDLYLTGIRGVGELRDKQLKVVGPAVDSLHDGFFRIWDDCGSVPLTNRAGAPLRDRCNRPSCARAGKTPVVIVETKDSKSFPNADIVYEELFSMARDTMKIISGYTIPDSKVIKALEDAAARGVVVEILTGSSTDMPSLLDKSLQRHVRKLSRRNVISLYVNPGGFHHDKVVSIDGRLLLVGSHNLDRLSFKHNHELSIIMDDPSLAARFNAYFDRCAGLRN